jgi:predicted O-methyltransferase YrrM
MRKYKISKFKNIEKLKLKYSKIFSEIVEIKKFSMLGNESLLLMAILAQKTRKGILEIGPYIGGSTVALGIGMRNRNNLRKNLNIIVSIESGGEYLTHEHLPSSDIIKDLKRNISGNQLEDLVTLCQGYSADQNVIQKVKKELNGKEISILFIDADGNLKRDIEIYGHYLKRGSILIVDDFFSEDSVAMFKAEEIYPVIMKLEENKCLIRIGVLPWGTYFGLVNTNKLGKTIET